MDYRFLRRIREHELDLAASHLPRGARVLEIGAGAGWQAEALSEKGFDVEAIDIMESRYLKQSIWPVTIYDGHHIPFGDAHFDAVFSSSALEHIPHLEKFQDEIRRVLKPGGTAVHILPTAHWRLWTSLTHYPYILKYALKMALPGPRPSAVKGRPQTAPHSSSILGKALWPHRHGEKGNSVTELYYFSRFYWLSLFKRTGWQIESYRPIGLFYTGNIILGSRLSLAARGKLSHILGSTTMIYVLRKSQE